MKSIYNFLTIDLEDWYQGLTSTSKHPEMWNTYEKRLTVGADWLIAALEAHEAYATFFIVGEVAREYPSLIRRICDKGHEVALHGDRHQRVDRMSRCQFGLDLHNNIEAIRGACGIRPSGYRAPCYSLGTDATWFWEELATHGLNFDSSIFPIKTPLYGLPSAPRLPHVVGTRKGEIIEYPITTFRLLGINLPFSGGFYFRMLPYSLIKGFISKLNYAGISVIFYFHPWEFDPEHPVAASTTLRERVSHYGRLRGNRFKFLKLLRDFRLVALRDS